MRGDRSFFRIGEGWGEEESALMGFEWNEMSLDYFKGVLHHFSGGHEHAHEFQCILRVSSPRIANFLSKTFLCYYSWVCLQN